MTERIGHCDCCWLVDGDERMKPTSLCWFCNAWLCEACKGDWGKRGEAFYKLHLKGASLQ
jgi:hypothetical protein